MTAMRKSKPRSSSYQPKVMRSWPVFGSCPTAASAKPNIIDAIGFMGGSLPMPTKLQNVSNWKAKSYAGPNASAKSATTGARKVRKTTAQKAPMNDAGNDDVTASPARPGGALGLRSKLVATDPGSPEVRTRRAEIERACGG